MAVIAVAPHVLKDVILTVGTDSYEKHVSTVRLVPSTETPQLQWQSLSPSGALSEAGSITTTWVLELEVAQDWETTNSLSQYLLTNAGTSKVIKLQPQRGAGKKVFTVTATIAPPPIGGQVNQVALSTVSCPVTGTPVISTDGTV